VIAVPAHFNDSQRHGVAAAVEMSGLSLLELVNEPIAAALAFAEHTSVFSPPGADQTPHAVLVYDLGGYTFEASVLWISPGNVTLVASEHDSFLGGHDWDLRLVDFLAEPFIRNHGFDPRDEAAHLDRLLQQAVQAKVALGVRSHTSVHLNFGGHTEKVTITRQQLEGMTGDLVARTAKICEAALERAKLTWSQVANVLLVGGATRMPMVRQLLAQKTGRLPDDHVCPEEAVARGAAIYAARLHMGQAGRPPALQVTSVSTHSLGIEGSDQRTGVRVNKVLIPKGTPLPAAATRDFFIKANASHTIVFNVLEGEDRHPSKCVTVGRVILRDLPPDLSDEWPVEVKYEYSRAGRLSVDARVRYTDRHVHLETLRPGGVSDAHVSRWKAVVTAQAGMAAYRQVRAWERAADARPPLVVAGIDLPKAPEPETEEPHSGGLLSFLSRVMPFAFRRDSQPATDAADETRSTVPKEPAESRQSGVRP
jgi:molecular chaperone DnaK